MTIEPYTISVKDAAKALGVGRTLIYTMISDHRLKAVKCSRRTLITTASIRALLGEA